MRYINLTRKNVTGSMEAAESGTKALELEYEFYGVLEDIDSLIAEAETTEYQEQYELKKPLGTIRVRMSRVGNETTYMLNSKTWEKGKPGKQEVEHAVTEDMFKHFRHIADSGMIKTRYSISAGKQRLSNGDLEKLVWEYDVFQDRDGKRSKWVKVDLEVKEVLATLPELPIALGELISNQKNFRTPSEVKRLTKLFQEEFLVPAGPGNVDQTEGVAVEGFFSNLFGKKVKIEKPEKFSISNITANFEHYRKMLNSSDFEPKTLELTDKDILSLTMEGNKEISPTVTADTISNSLKRFASKISRYEKEVAKYDDEVQKFIKDIDNDKSITEEKLGTALKELRNKHDRVLKAFPGKVSVIGGSVLEVQDGSVAIDNFKPHVSSVSVTTDPAELLALLDLYEQLVNDSHTRLPLLDSDNGYSDFSHADEILEITDDNMELSDELGDLTYHQTVVGTLETGVSSSLFSAMYGLQKLIYNSFS